MEKLMVAGPKRLAKELLAELQRAGVVHIEPLRTEELGEYRLSPEEDGELRRWEAVAAGAEHALGILGRSATPTKPFTGSLSDAEAILKPWAERAEVLGRERAALEEELQAIQLFGSVAERLAGLAHGLDRSERLAVIPFLVSKAEELEPVRAALQASLEDRFLLESEALPGQVAAVVVVLRRDLEAARSALSRQGLAELRFPVYGTLPLTQVAARMRERSKLAPEELMGIREEVAKLAQESKDSLEALWTRAKDEVARLRSLADMAAGKYGFALMGWVPQDAKGRVEMALGRLKDGIIYTFEPVDEHHEADQVPVTLKNPAWARPFELLHGFLNTPRYGGYDPTVMIATTFPFFFGMVVGDIAFGLLFFLAARLFAGYARRGETLEIGFLGAKMGPEVLGQLSKVLSWMAFWAVVWGFLYGEFLGTFLEKLHVFYDPNHHGEAGEAAKGLIPILINRLDFERTANLLIVISLAFGVFQVLYAFGVRAYYAYKHRHMSHFWEGLGYLAGLVGLVAFAYTFQTGKGAPLTYILLAVGLAIFLVSVFLARIPLMIAELPGKGGQILSYIRIYAVGVAGAVLYDLANQVGFGLANSIGILGVLLGLLLGGLMVILITAVTLLGHVLQPIRLLWIEFASNFGFYDESGKPYRPFRSVRGEAS
ncbi:MAG: V-type ATP synthase subunit I [Meiothermus sp.]